MSPELTQVLQGVDKANIRFDSAQQSIHIAGGPAVSVENLRTPQFTKLQPESFGIAVLQDQETVTLQVDAHTQVILEGHANGHTVYRLLVDGHERLGTILNRPAVIGRDPRFQLINWKTDPIRVAEAADDTSLLLVPTRSEDGSSGYFVVNMSTRPMGIRSSFVEKFTEQQRRVRVPQEDMPTVRLPDGQIPEHVTTYPPVLSHAAVEAKSPAQPSEDRVVIKRQPTTTMLLADGMGGHGHGDEAAQKAIKVVSEYEDDNIPPNATSEQVAEGLRQAFSDAHKKVNKLDTALVETYEGVEKHQPGTTMVVGRLVYGEGPTGTRLVLAWAGDSRAYIQNPDGTLELLTTDDNLQQSYGRSHAEFVVVQTSIGLKIERFEPILKEHRNLQRYSIDEQQAKEIDRILDEIEDPAQLQSDVLIAFYNMRNYVTNHVGGGETNVNPHARIVDVPPGSRIWYTSDGIHDAVPESYLSAVFAKAAQLAPEDRASYVLYAINEWNRTHTEQRHKYDDKAVGYQEIPLAA